MKTRNIQWPVCFWLLFACLSLQAQDNSKTDSLLSLLGKNPSDTAKIDLYIALHKNLLTDDSAQAMNYLRHAISLSEKIDDKKGIAMSYLNLGDHLWKTGSYNEAKQALVNVKKQNDMLKDPKIEALYHNQLGTICSILGDYDQAMQQFFLALAGFEAIKDSAGMGSSYTNIGNVYLNLAKYDEALQYYRKGLEIAQNIKNSKGAANALGNMASAYSNKKNFDSAMVYLKRSLVINRKSGFLEDTRIDLYNIGRLYRKREKTDSAKFYFEQAKALAVSINSKRGILFADHALAILERDLGNYSRSIKMLDEALPLAMAMGMKREIMNFHLSYAYNYESSKNYKLALDHRKLYENWYDSLNNEQYVNKIKELELKYETEKKDQQITLLAQQKELQEKETQRQATLKNASIGGVLLIVFLGGLLLYTLQQRLKNQKAIANKDIEIKEAHFKRQLTELEMKALQAQINPHFIFNCMNSINQMILDGDNPNASKYLTKFGRLIRLILENAEEPEVSLKNELMMLESYIQLEALRFNGKIQYRIELKDDIDPENTWLPSMVLQPFVENAIWHGLMPRDKPLEGLISISIGRDKDQLWCRIEDNGIGREKALELQQKSVWKSKSLGLKITEERLRLLGKGLQEQLIRITDLKDELGQALGTRVEIVIG